MTRPATEGGAPDREKFLPFAFPSWATREKAEVVAALDSGWISTGPRHKEVREPGSASTWAPSTRWL
jgi:dTDP-4-amino-4,6-dideoxygalactose transaminase